MRPIVRRAGDIVHRPSRVEWARARRVGRRARRADAKAERVLEAIVSLLTTRQT
jgi:hypothetical protein